MNTQEIGIWLRFAGLITIGYGLNHFVQWSYGYYSIPSLIGLFIMWVGQTMVYKEPFIELYKKVMVLRND